jgi:hypothetical protein
VAALAEGPATGACCPAVGPACAGSSGGPLCRAAGRPYPERWRLLARAQRLGLGLNRVWALLGRAFVDGLLGALGRLTLAASRCSAACLALVLLVWRERAICWRLLWARCSPCARWREASASRDSSREVGLLASLLSLDRSRTAALASSPATRSRRAVLLQRRSVGPSPRPVATSHRPGRAPAERPVGCKRLILAPLAPNVRA